MNEISRKKDIILFIDDEKICHTLVELIIPNFTNYKLISAFNGEEALQLARRYVNNLSLIFSDIILPDINGYEIYNILKKEEKFLSIPFVFQSGLTEQENELKKHIKTKEVSVIYKPYKQADILDIIERQALKF